MYVCIYLWNGLKKVEDYLTALELIQTARRLFHKEQLFQISSMRAVGAQVVDALTADWIVDNI